MAYSFNRSEIIGRVGRDVELRHTREGHAVATLSLATDRPSKAGGDSETDWHVVVCWDKLAELVGAHVAKGRLLFVAGRLQYRSWEDKEGKSRRTAEIVANEVILLDRKPGPDLRVVGGDEPDLPF
jgi:single-strand DNA-binding protein